MCFRPGGAVMDNKICPTCGAFSLADAKTCRKCGTDLTDVPLNSGASAAGAESLGGGAAPGMKAPSAPGMPAPGAPKSPGAPAAPSQK